MKTIDAKLLFIAILIAVCLSGCYKSCEGGIAEWPSGPSVIPAGSTVFP